MEDWVCPKCRRGEHEDGYGHEPMRPGDDPLCHCLCINLKRGLMTPDQVREMVGGL